MISKSHPLSIVKYNRGGGVGQGFYVSKVTFITKVRQCQYQVEGIMGKADRQLFDPELFAIATPVNKCLRKGEIQSFSTGVICALLTWSERKREPCQAHCSAGVENVNSESHHT